MSAPDSGPANSVTSYDGKRYYYHPFKLGPDGAAEKFVSVTTGCDAMASPGLPYWYGAEAGKLAMDSLPTLLRAARVDPCEGGPNRCRGCIACAARWLGEQGKRESERRSSEGRALHYAVKMWISMGCPVDPKLWPAMDDAIVPYWKTFLQWWRDLGLTAESVLLSEATVLNRAHWFAGTLDMALRVVASATWRAAELVYQVSGRWAGSVDVIIDLKSREKIDDPRFFPDMGLQLIGYQHGETIMDEGGAETPMPKLDGAAVVQIRPDGYAYRVVDEQPGDFEGFVAHLAAFRWQCERGDRIIGARARPLPDEMQGTEAAAARVLKANPHRMPKKATRKASPRKASRRVAEVADEVEAGTLTSEDLRPLARAAGERLKRQRPAIRRPPDLQAHPDALPMRDDGLPDDMEAFLRGEGPDLPLPTGLNGFQRALDAAGVAGGDELDEPPY